MFRAIKHQKVLCAVVNARNRLFFRLLWTEKGENSILEPPLSRKTAKPPGDRREQTSALFLALSLLALVILALFQPTLHSDFVYDSVGEIVAWDYLHNPGNLLTALSFRLISLDVLDFNRPVAVASLMIDSIFSGRAPFGYHLTNILLHVAVACLGFLFLRHILTQKNRLETPWRNWIVFLAMLLFAVHPIVTEAVCEPSNRKDLLAALFGLTALLLAARHRQDNPRGDLARLVLCPFLCLLAIGSKEVGVAYPAILFLYWVLFRRHEPAKFWASILAGSAVVDVIFLIARFKLEHRPSAIFLSPPTYIDGSLAHALLVQPRILALYVVNLLWPVNLCADYGAYSIGFLPLGLALVILAVIVGLLTWWSMKDRRVFFAAGFIGATILPVCNLVPIYHPAADRYLYNPLIGLVLLVAIALDTPWLAAKFPRRTLTSLVGLLLVGLLIPITRERERVWSSEILLWQNTMERNPRSFPAWTNLPEALLKAGRLSEAKARAEASLKTPYATWPWIWFDYALILNRLGDQAGAQTAARHALAIKPDIADVDKMVDTLQGERDLEEEFAPIAASRSRPNATIR